MRVRARRTAPRAGSGAGRADAAARGPDGPRRSERGVASLEYLGMLPFLLLVALAGIQLGIAAYCGEQAGTAARTAARTAAQAHPGTDPATAGKNAVSGWVNPDIDLSGGDDRSVRATATVQVPSVLPGLSVIDPITRSATMPREDTTP